MAHGLPVATANPGEPRRVFVVPGLERHEGRPVEQPPEVADIRLAARPSKQLHPYGVTRGEIGAFRKQGADFAADRATRCAQKFDPGSWASARSA